MDLREKKRLNAPAMYIEVWRSGRASPLRLLGIEKSKKKKVLALVVAT